MKRILTIVTGIIIMFSVTAQNSGTKEATETGTIQFNTASWNEILATAKSENKPVFLDISASWCGYCKRMKANVFTDPQVGKFYNANFINVSVDGEKGEGIQLAKKYGVKGYPTFVFLNPDGSLAFQTSGYHKSEEFLELAKKANQ
ncbi:MAG: thioredoxin family protein [Bacteroidales bacterium]|nr:thioredoxin family protein [Bacteroidales bacterium]